MDQQYADAVLVLVVAGILVIWLASDRPRTRLLASGLVLLSGLAVGMVFPTPNTAPPWSGFYAICGAILPTSVHPWLPRRPFFLLKLLGLVALAWLSLWLGLVLMPV